MDILGALIGSFALLVISVTHGVFVAYPLLITLGLLVAVLARRGFALRNLMGMAIAGSRKSFSVIGILLIIGAVTAVWMAAGTVPAIVYYGIQLINPNLFVLCAFLLTSFVSFLIGTSFGAASTIGTALMIMARGSSVDPHLVAGAVIAGAYWGDRCSPMSSSANLVAAVTKSDLYQNIQNMLATGWLPTALACVIYAVISFFYPVQNTSSSLSAELAKLFDLNLITFLPAIVILVLALLKLPVKQAMLWSIAAGVVLAFTLQHYTLLQILQFSFTGFHLEQESSIRSILAGGGIVSMMRVCAIVIVSTAISGVLTGTNALGLVQKFLQSFRSRSGLFVGTTLVSIGASAFGCTQAIAILLTAELVKPQYEAHYKTPEIAADRLAIDLENTAVVIAPLIPWNIAGLVPATVLMSDSGFIPFAVYLYLIPLCYWVVLRSGREAIGSAEFSQKS
ncbi:Na+/H+ antiporter NhaC family protein [Leptolyngbya ohadii]|uniref:Na+/H+ antiporter NhaC family protein n=1 Tax=Leptolyngbya ohadii TaxID=1962290 RepID=UPI000B5A1C66|nr:Na+/H+ antiporter NhaC family protein [Leptolyngbya ohadii]